jgi:hypothetical protein
MWGGCEGNQVRHPLASWTENWETWFLTGHCRGPRRRRLPNIHCLRSCTLRGCIQLFLPNEFNVLLKKFTCFPWSSVFVGQGHFLLYVREVVFIIARILLPSCLPHLRTNITFRELVVLWSFQVFEIVYLNVVKCRLTYMPSYYKLQIPDLQHL